MSPIDWSTVTFLCVWRLLLRVSRTLVTLIAFSRWSAAANSRIPPLGSSTDWQWRHRFMCWPPQHMVWAACFDFFLYVSLCCIYKRFIGLPPTLHAMWDIVSSGKPEETYCRSLRLQMDQTSFKLLAYISCCWPFVDMFAVAAAAEEMTCRWPAMFHRCHANPKALFTTWSASQNQI